MRKIFQYNYTALKIGTQIRKQREIKGMVQQELGKAVGVTRGCVCNYESGLNAPTLEGFIALADFFGVSLDGLAGREHYSDKEGRTERDMEIKILNKLLEDALEGKLKYRMESEKYQRFLADARKQKRKSA